MTKKLCNYHKKKGTFKLEMCEICRHRLKCDKKHEAETEALNAQCML